MATGAAVFTKAPCIRTPPQVVDSIFRSGPKDATRPSPSKPENKRVWASLTAEPEFVSKADSECTEVCTAC